MQILVLESSEMARTSMLITALYNDSVWVKLVPQSLANSRRLRCKVLYDPEWIEGSSSMVVRMHGETIEPAMKSIASNVIRQIQSNISTALVVFLCELPRRLPIRRSPFDVGKRRNVVGMLYERSTFSMGLLVAFVSPSENRNRRFTAFLGLMEWTICVQPNRYHILESPEKKRLDHFVSIGGHFSVLGRQSLLKGVEGISNRYLVRGKTSA